MSKLLRNTLLYAIGNFLPKAVGFLLLPIYANFLTPVEYGIVESMQIFSMLVAIVFSLATERSLYRLYYDYESDADKEQFIGNVSMLILFFSLLSMGGIFYFNTYVGRIYSEIEFSPYFTLAIFQAFMMTFALTPSALLQIQERAVSFVLISAASLLLTTALVIYFVVVKEEAAVGVLKARLIGSILLLPAYLWIIFRWSSFVPNLEMMRNALSFSIPMLPILISTWVVLMSNRIFIEQFFSLHEVGVFSLAFRISTLVMVAGGAVFSAFNPYFFRNANSKDLQSGRRHILESSKIIVLAIIFTGFLTSFFSREVIGILSAEYSDAYLLVPVLSAAAVFIQVSGIYNLMLYQDKKVVLVMLVTLGGAVLSVTLNYGLISIWGMYGAGLASFVVAIVLCITKSLFAQKGFYFSVPFRELKWIILLCVVSILFDLYVLPEIRFGYSILFKIIVLSLVLASMLRFLSLERFHKLIQSYRR